MLIVTAALERPALSVQGGEGEREHTGGELGSAGVQELGGSCFERKEEALGCGEGRGPAHADGEDLCAEGAVCCH